MMSNPTLSVSKFAGLAPLLGGLARSAVLAQLSKLRHGHLRLLSHGQQWSFGDADSPLQAEVEILDDATWSLIMRQWLDRSWRSLHSRLLAQPRPGAGDPPVRRQP